MNVVYTFDDGYSEITAVSIVSLLKNNKQVKDLRLYIIDCGIKENNKEILTKLVQGYDRTVTFVSAVDLSKKIKVELDTFYWNQVCYVRLFFAEMLPSLDKVLHIDCDTIVRGNVEEIYNTDLNDYICAACYDCSPCPKVSAGFNEAEPYYSNGLLLFNLKAIRDEGIEEQFIKYVEGKNGKLSHLDQDVINGVLNHRIKVLPPQYNLMTTTILFGKSCTELFSECEPYYSKEMLDNAVANPVIIHLVGHQFVSRPWAQPCYHPYNDEWVQYYKQTPYQTNGKIFSYKKKKYGLAREIACLLWSLGYKNKPIRALYFAHEKHGTWKYKKNINKA